MIELTLWLCLIANPAECREERLPWNGDLFSCAHAGQFQAAAWVSGHPGWRVTRWRCGPAETAA